jgi:broad specificity phosphatase PhoE
LQNFSVNLALNHGDTALALVEEVLADGVRHAVVLMRHSAREFAPGRHDLLNPLTEEGRASARALGERLPKTLTLRGYASPPERCMETAALVLDGHRGRGGQATRHRPLEALGVFYALDQMRMWKGMDAAGGLVPYLGAWLRGDVPPDAMMPAPLAAEQVLRVLTGKLRQTLAEQQVDLCVSHDMTLYLMRAMLLEETVDGPPVEFLDALVLYEREGGLWMRSHHGGLRRVG